jgi:hypothetical protein
LPQSLSGFFSNGTSIRNKAILNLIDQLKPIYDTLQNNTQGVRFYGASVLLSYCADQADSQLITGYG